MFVGVQACVVNIIVVVVLIVKRWGLNRRTFLSVKVPECVINIINIIIAFVVIVKRWGLNRMTLNVCLLKYRSVLTLSSPSSSSSRGGV